MQQQQRRSLADHGDREGIFTAETGKIPPLQLVRQLTGLRIEQAGAELINQGFQE